MGRRIDVRMMEAAIRKHKLEDFAAIFEGFPVRKMTKYQRRIAQHVKKIGQKQDFISETIEMLKDRIGCFHIRPEIREALTPAKMPKASQLAKAAAGDSDTSDQEGSSDPSSDSDSD